MIEAVVEVQESTLKTVQGLLGRLLDEGIVEALLVPMTLPAAEGVAPMLVTDPAVLVRSDPLAPVLHRICQSELDSACRCCESHCIQS